ncbi:kappa-B-binding protein-like nuclear factor NFRKB [Acrasis kona]|uniref:Kappa-B-binding protein-like nuclear factor NFRKB n=1 Tax=Acrasis kona TaxID=1008807 RepID=A0AAW2YI10_9EUKA
MVAAKKKRTKKKPVEDKKEADAETNNIEEDFAEEESNEKVLIDDKLFHDEESTRFEHIINTIGVPWTHISQHQVDEANGKKRKLSPEEQVVFEPALVEGQSLLVPVVALQNPSILDEILSVNTWKNVLNDHDRGFLKRYLPPSITSSETKLNQTVGELLSGQNFHFGNDKKRMINKLLLGHYHPFIAKHKEHVRFIQQKEHDLDVQLYTSEFDRNIYNEKASQGLLMEEKKKTEALNYHETAVESIFEDDDMEESFSSNQQNLTIDE